MDRLANEFDQPMLPVYLDRKQLTPTEDGTGTEIDFKIYVDPDLPLPSAVFSRENERAAGRAVRALRQRMTEAPGGAA